MSDNRKLATCLPDLETERKPRLKVVYFAPSLVERLDLFEELQVAPRVAFLISD